MNKSVSYRAALLFFEYCHLFDINKIFFTKQVKESSGGVRGLGAIHEWEEQGNRGRTEQQRWAGRLLIRIGLVTRDPHSLPYHLHPPTACRSATYTQTPIVLSAQALKIRSSMFLHRYVVPYKHEHSMPSCIAARPQKKTHTQNCSSEMDSWSSGHARVAFFAFLSPRRMTLGRGVAHITLPYITLVL